MINSGTFKELGFGTSIPFVLASGPIIGFFIGRFIDSKLNTSSFFMVFFLVIGFIASVRQTIRLIKDMQQDNNND